MGTSRNDRSPLTPPWKIALAVLGTDVSPNRQGVEIWRAVAADRGEKLLRDFSNPALAAASQWVAQGLSVQEALTRFNRSTMHESSAGLAIDIGRRALTRCAAERGDAASFAGELFAEAVVYYASRDLPSYVGATGRVPNSSESIRLKHTLRETTKSLVKGLGQPGVGRRAWKKYVSKALKVLQTGSVKE